MIKAMSILAAAALLLGGCAAFNNLSNEVSTYGSWPAERRPSTFAFERLPSEQTHPERQQALENAALGALEASGFRAAPEASAADYLVQVGARVVDNDPWVYNDSLFLRGRIGWGGRWGRPPGWWGPPWGWEPGLGGGFYSRFDSRSFGREVVLVIRDQHTGQVLYEARANNAGPSPAIDYLLPAMFAAAMKDFPTVNPNPREIVTPISKPIPLAPVPATAPA